MSIRTNDRSFQNLKTAIIEISLTQNQIEKAIKS